MQLVGCTPTSGCGGFGTTTSQFFLVLLGSRATQCRVTEESASCMWHSILPTGVAVEKLSLHCWSLIIPSMIIIFCSFSTILVLASLECVCTSSPVDVCLWFPYLCFCICSWLVNHKLIGLDTLLSSSHITLFQLCFSICHLFPCTMEQKLSLEWLDISFLTLCPPPFMLSLLKNNTWVGFFFFFTFGVIQNNCGLTSIQTVACCYFHAQVRLLHEPKSTTDTGNYTEGRADKRILLPIQQRSQTDGFFQVSRQGAPPWKYITSLFCKWDTHPLVCHFWGQKSPIQSKTK